MSDFKKFEQPIGYEDEMKNIFDRFVKEGKLEGYRDPEFNGMVVLNGVGSKALGMPEGEDWISFTYTDLNHSGGNDELFYGVINPKDGEVNSTEHHAWWDTKK